MGWTVQGSVPGSDKNFYVLQIIHTCSVANPASYSGGTDGCSPGLTYEAYYLHLSTAKDKND